MERGYLFCNDQASVPSAEMAVLRSLDMGQFCSAFLTLASKTSLVIPGTLPVTVKCDLVTAPFSKVMSQRVSRDSGVNPASPNMNVSFMVKQPAWAAATNSSGFVPTPSANLELYEYWV